MHQKQWKFLKKAFAANKLGHAFLFSGPKGTGKKQTALALAKMVACQKVGKNLAACGQCPSCLAFSRGVHPDFYQLRLAEEKKEIAINQVRGLIGKLGLKPILSQYKVAIIESAQLMNAAAQNCLFKTLEEPKGKTVLILLSEQPDNLLATVRSRVQEIKFQPLSAAELERFLKQAGASSEQARQISPFALGSLEKALAYLKNPDKMDFEQRKAKEFLRVVSADVNGRFQYAEALAKKPILQVIEIWLKCLRRGLIAKLSNRKVAFAELENFSLPRLEQIIIGLEDLHFILSRKRVNQRLALEAFMLEQ
jgi:DNA polymerase-3 subunit delta'